MRKSPFSSPRIHAQARAILSGLCALAFLFLFYNRVDVLRNPLLRKSSDFRRVWPVNGDSGLIRRRAVEISNNSIEQTPAFCAGLLNHSGFSTPCEYLNSHRECSSGGFFNYLKFFYCDCQNVALLGYLVLAIWLAALFYLLGNTAADYFCCSLEKLSGLLKLAPTVAGVTLLPLGNGAPDVFASIAAFVGTGAGDVGLNSVLGGAVFVTCVVVGTVSVLVADRGFQIDRKCFVRDIAFFLATIFSLLLILIKGQIGVFMAVGFVLIYAVYAFSVAANEIIRKHAQRLKLDSFTPLSVFSNGDENAVYSPLLDFETNPNPNANPTGPPPSLPQWMWASNVAIYKTSPDGDRPWGWTDDDVDHTHTHTRGPSLCSRVCYIIEFPFTAIRRLTIPMVNDESWSKPYAVASACLAPILLAILVATQDNISRISEIAVYLLGAATGLVFGILAYWYTVKEHPPRRYVLVWVLGGFIMSIVWFYMVANELVSLLVSFGVMFGINPSILGLTVLAWGNSMGDLVSNIALALNGEDGVQIALSGCYAGPMFNVLIGLGFSLVIAAWSSRPEMYIVPEDASLFLTIGFLVTGLVLAGVFLTKNDMRPTRAMGVGLIGLYVVFLCIRVGSAMGMWSVHLI